MPHFYEPDLGADPKTLRLFFTPDKTNLIQPLSAVSGNIFSDFRRLSDHLILCESFLNV
jgi:hypothetical protein